MASLSLLVFLFALPAFAQQPMVTATTCVDDWADHKGKARLRKINDLWWTDDNCEVYAPGVQAVLDLRGREALRLEPRFMVALVDESR